MLYLKYYTSNIFPSCLLLLRPHHPGRPPQMVLQRDLSITVPTVGKEACQSFPVTSSLSHFREFLHLSVRLFSMEQYGIGVLYIRFSCIISVLRSINSHPALFLVSPAHPPKFPCFHWGSPRGLCAIAFVTAIDGSGQATSF
jgi:hypothetical protein